MERMHPEDLRAIVAAHAYGGACADPTCTGFNFEVLARNVDYLLAELERTAKPDPGAIRPGMAATLEQELHAATARAERADGWLDAAWAAIPSSWRRGNGRQELTLNDCIKDIIARAEKAEAELAAVDFAIGNREAFDPFKTRAQKISYAIKMEQKAHAAELESAPKEVPHA